MLNFVLLHATLCSILKMAEEGPPPLEHAEDGDDAEEMPTLENQAEAAGADHDGKSAECCRDYCT